jgi:hypothetical protein
MTESRQSPVTDPPRQCGVDAEGYVSSGIDSLSQTRTRLLRGRRCAKKQVRAHSENTFG